MKRLTTAISRAVRESEERKKRRQAETRSRELSQFLHQAREAVVVTDLDGRITFWNRGAEELSGWNAADAVDKRCQEIFPAAITAQLAEACKTATERGEWAGEFPFQDRSGAARVLDLRLTLIRDDQGRPRARLALGTDITERRQAEEALRSAEAKYRALVEQSLMGVYIMQDERLVYVNPKAANLLGYSQQEMIDAKQPFLFVHEQDRALVRDQLGRLDPERMPSVQLALRGIRKDGEVIQVEAFCSVTEFGNQRARPLSCAAKLQNVHPLVVGRPFIRFYAAARLVVKGQTVGTLCAYDVSPREITPDQVLHLQQMAGAVVEFLRRHRAPC
jgi:PAS domain S-box-containing protein